MTTFAQMLSGVHGIAEKVELPVDKVVAVIVAWEAGQEAERAQRCSTAEERMAIKDAVPKLLQATPTMSARDIAARLEIRMNQGCLASITREMKKYKALNGPAKKN